MLKITNLTKSFGEKKAVDNISLEIKTGEICGFIGHNGAGKTTTIKVVCGILGFDSGQIEVCGYDVKKEPLKVKQNIAYIPDNPDIYEFMTGIKYLNFIADCFNISKDVRTEKIAKYAGLFELTDSLGGLVSSYSHGMKQKLALISAFIHEPKLLILDEPFVGLDPTAARTVKNLMRDLCKSGGAVFFSSHVLETVEKLCDSVAVIKNGKLIAHGDTEKIRGDASLEEVFFDLEEANA
jgi:ABC-2 type transport system ATP-binding protein